MLGLILYAVLVFIGLTVTSIALVYSLYQLQGNDKSLEQQDLVMTSFASEGR